MPIFGKNKIVNIIPTFDIDLDKNDKSYKNYNLPADRDKCVKELEDGKNWGIESLELQNEPAKNSTDPGDLKIKSIKLLSYPTTTKGHQDSGTYKYYVDSPTNGSGSKDRLWLESCKATITKQEDPVYNPKKKLHEIEVNVKVTAKLTISVEH